MLNRMLCMAGAIVLALTLHSRAADANEFPAGTHWILTVDVKAAQAAPLLQSLVEKMDTNKIHEAKAKLAAAKAMFGIDLLKDIDHVIIAGNGDAQKGGVAYIYGVFDAQRLTTILGATKNYAMTNHGEIAVQSWVDEKDNKQKYLAFARPGLAILSNTQSAITDVLDVLAGKQPSLASDSPLRNAFKRDARNLVSLNVYGLSSIVGSTPKAEAFKQTEALSLCVSTPDETSISACMSVTATSDETALQVQQALQGIQAIILLRAAEAPESAALASQAKITCQGRMVGLSVTLPRELIENAVRAHEAKKAAKRAETAAANPVPSSSPVATQKN